VTDNSFSLIASAVGTGARSVMACRVEQRESLDFFPTPPWATRALVERTLPHIGADLVGVVWQPACGEGHMSDTLAEYATVISNIELYRHGQKVQDFLDTTKMVPEVDWIVTTHRSATGPCTCHAFFMERVPLCKGRWDPDGSTATAQPLIM
jgi:hypothetical protein